MPTSDPFIPSLQALLASYGLSASARIVRLSVSENHTYLVTDGSKKCVMRVHRAGYHTREEILSELDWIGALHGNDALVTAQPIPRLDGERISHINADGQERWVSVFSHLDGEEPKVGGHLATRFQALGAINARLHEHAKTWQAPDGFTRKRWDFDLMFGNAPIWGDWRAAGMSERDKGVLETLQSVIQRRLADYGDAPHRFGLIHGDLRVANLLDDGQRLAVIDFDDCGFGWFAYDFAAAISFHEDDPSVPALQAAWLQGYRTVAPFSAQDEAILPTLIIARRLLLTAWLTSRAGNDTETLYGNGFATGTVQLALAYLDAA